MSNQTNENGILPEFVGLAEEDNELRRQGLTREEILAQQRESFKQNDAEEDPPPRKVTPLNIPWEERSKIEFMQSEEENTERQPLRMALFVGVMVLFILVVVGVLTNVIHL